MQKISWRQPRLQLETRQYQYVIGLVLLSIVLVLLRNQFLPANSHAALGLSQLQLSFELSGGQKGVTDVRLSVPISSSNHRVVSQTMNYAGWRIKHRNYKEIAERGIRLQLNSDAAKALISFEYVIDSTEAKNVIARPLTLEQRQRYLHISAAQKRSLNIVQEPSQSIQTQQQLNDFLEQHSGLWRSAAYDTDLGLYGCEQDYRIQQRLLLQLRARNLPSRFVCGLAIEEGHAQRRGVIESYIDEHWAVVQVININPQNFIPFYRGEGGFFKVEGPGKITFKSSVKMLNKTSAEYDWQRLLDLKQLPVSTQQLLEVILILPLAVLIIAYLRLVWQVPMLGSLTPALLGMALAFNEIWLSLILLVAVLGPLFWIRHLSHSSNKIVTHGMTLTFITLLLIVMLVLLDFYAVLDSPSDIILPTVLLVLFIDKYYQSYNKQGAKQANWQMFYTLGFAFSIVPIVQYTSLGFWLLSYPELHLITLALLIMLWQQPVTPTLNDNKIADKADS
ncbi:7TM domain-containing protein [Thiomicrorhabdus sediminis]|uniref:7TM domain-containing protein n=1 Tax=Thiomicrorhabdus sediminis TaxID=2580412 RepID=UPI00143CFBA9|nr:7TM domain-containing protein [Thiomicrorhabdus sediminis]